MTQRAAPALLSILFITTALLVAAPVPAQDAASAIQACLDCHDYGEDAPAHQVLLGSHGIDGEVEDMAGRRGCLDCHGASTAHIDAPRQQAPDVSFGPRWSASGSAQDKPCLTCHEQDVAGHWQSALHMVNNMTCITCHDIHSEQDRVLVAEEQNQVCTTCHKVQKTGIHNLGDAGPRNPPCSLCHNPHNDETAAPQMAANQSAGCTFCHDAKQMDTLAALNPRAGNYHRSLKDDKRGCLDCHQGISHAPEDSAPLLHPAPTQQRKVTLFYPGNATRQWLISDHPGSQPLRQGTDCALCHRGDEAQMGVNLGSDLVQPSRQLDVAFSRDGDQLFIDISWEATEDDQQLALMWGDDDNTEFRRAGCFAACHDNGQSEASRILYHGDNVDATATMGALPTGAGLWRITLATGELESADVGARMQATPVPNLMARAQSRADRWSVRFIVDATGNAPNSRFKPDQRYTFGIALHGSNNPGRQHWVSLPMTFSLSGNSTDFVAR